MIIKLNDHQAEGLVRRGKKIHQKSGHRPAKKSLGLVYISFRILRELVSERKKKQNLPYRAKSSYSSVVACLPIHSKTA